VLDEKTMYFHQGDYIHKEHEQNITLKHNKTSILHKRNSKSNPIFDTETDCEHAFYLKIGHHHG